MAHTHWASLNGRVLDPSQPAFTVDDRCFLYGHGALETWRTHRGHCPGLGLRMARLEQSCARLRIGPLPAVSALVAWCLELIDRCDASSDLVLRMVVSAGVSSDGFHPTGLAPNVVLLAQPLPKSLAGGKAAPPVSLCTLACEEVGFAPPRGVKSTSYISSYLAQAQAKERGHQEALMVASDGLVVDGATSSLAFLRLGPQPAIVLPTAPGRTLDGITLRLLEPVVRSLGYAFQRRPVTRAELIRFDGGFLASSVSGLRSILGIDTHVFKGEEAARCFRRVSRGFTAYLASQRQNGQAEIFAEYAVARRVLPQPRTPSYFSHLRRP